MSPSRSPRLDEGGYKHVRCPDCVEPKPLLSALAEDVRTIRRLRSCGELLVDFSVVIQREDAQGWRTVARFSVAHANFHVIQYTWDPRDRGMVRSMGPIDRVEDVTEAYRLAVTSTYSDLETFLERWRATRRTR